MMQPVALFAVGVEQPLVGHVVGGAGRQRAGEAGDGNDRGERRCP